MTELSTFQYVRQLFLKSLIVLGLCWLVSSIAAPHPLYEYDFKILPGLSFPDPLHVHRSWGLLWFAAFSALLLVAISRDARQDHGSDEDYGYLICAYAVTVLVAGLLSLLGLFIGAVLTMVGVAWLAGCMKQGFGLTQPIMFLAVFLWGASVTGVWAGLQSGLVHGLLAVASYGLVSTSYLWWPTPTRSPSVAS